MTILVGGQVAASSELNISPVARDIGGAKICVWQKTAAVAWLTSRFERRIRTSVTFANTNLIVKASGLENGRGLLSEMTILNDGVGVNLASRILYGQKFPENLNGTDFTPALLKALPPGRRVFLYGARPAIVRFAAAAIARECAMHVCGTADGYSGDEGLVGRMNAAGAEVVLVALGNPAQEQWIALHRVELDAPLVAGVGALFDFLAGAVPRAPDWVRDAGLEWAYRWLREPRRLTRRYTIDVAKFMALILQQRFGPRFADTPNKGIPSEKIGCGKST